MSAIAFPKGVEASPTGLVLPESLSQDEWLSAGQQLAKCGAALQWWVGDWLNYGDREYGEITEAVEELGLNYNTATKWAWVAREFESCLRRQDVPFSAYWAASGESRIGAEIKYDDKAASTGNLFIEIEERRDTSGNWRPAGIYDAGESWLYIIGNYHCIWIFGTRFLQALHKSGKYDTKDTGTARGFLLPGTDVEKYYLRKISGEQLTTIFTNGKKAE